jgi:hypothetical protein
MTELNSHSLVCFMLAVASTVGLHICRFSIIHPDPESNMSSSKPGRLSLNDPNSFSNPGKTITIFFKSD